MLRRIAGLPRCLFVVVPDVVGNAQATLHLFDEWWQEVDESCQPKALVAQDGMEYLDVPWGCFDALFIGGSTAWKLSAASADLCREAKARGKWLHMGRVNSRRRMRDAFEMGCDSVDGSSASRFADKFLQKYLRWIVHIESQRLITEEGRSDG